MRQRPAEEVSEYERQYQDGSDPKVRDIIDLVLIEPRPKNYQSENWLLDANAYWEKSGTASWDEITALADSPASLWINGHSTGKGMNDQIPLTAVTGIASSLTLIHVLATQLVVWEPSAGWPNSKRRVQAHFDYAGVRYCLWVTDPVFEREYLAKDNGTYGIGECYLTISLSEPFNDHCFKLVAAIIPA